jgi:hypothetical protein
MCLESYLHSPIRIHVWRLINDINNFNLIVHKTILFDTSLTKSIFHIYFSKIHFDMIHHLRLRLWTGIFIEAFWLNFHVNFCRFHPLYMPSQSHLFSRSANVGWVAQTMRLLLLPFSLPGPAILLSCSHSSSISVLPLNEPLHVKCSYFAPTHSYLARIRNSTFCPTNLHGPLTFSSPLWSRLFIRKVLEQ